MSSNSDENQWISINENYGDDGLRKFAHRLTRNMGRDILVQQTIDEARLLMNVDRIAIYYFYCEWEGQVIYQSLSYEELSIFGSKGAENCFNDHYAAMYLAGRIRDIPDIELAGLEECHLEFLRSINVKANLVVPILNPLKLWGLLIAHSCQKTRDWLNLDIEIMQKAAETLGNNPVIRQNN